MLDFIGRVSRLVCRRLPMSDAMIQPVCRPQEFTAGSFARRADLVHEINSPLAYSLLSAQIALRSLRDDDDPAVRRCIERAIEGIHRASLAARELLRNS